MNMLRSLFGQVLEISLAMGVVIAALLALRLALGKRYRAKAWYWVWLLAALRLAVPFHAALPQAPVHITVPDPTIMYSRTAPAKLPGEDALPTQGVGHAQTGMPIQGALAGQGNGAAPAEDDAHWAKGGQVIPPAPVNYAPSLTLAQLAGAVWGLGCAAFLAWNLLSYARFRRWMACRRREVESEEIARRFDALAEELGVKKLALGKCSGLPSPLVTGFIRPTLLLPREDYAPEELDAILRHELIHAKRGDLWYKLLLLWVRAVHWFDPLVHLMARRAERDLEISCDEAVVAGRDGAFHAQYGHAVLSAAERGLSRPAPLTSQFKGGKKALKERIGVIADRAVRRRGTAVVCVAALAVAIAAGACSVSREKEPGEKVIYATYSITEQDTWQGKDQAIFHEISYDQERGSLGEYIGKIRLNFAEEIAAKQAAEDGDEERVIMREEDYQEAYRTRERDIFSFLNWPSLRSVSYPNTVDVLKLTLTENLEEGIWEVTAMEWLLVPRGEGEMLPSDTSAPAGDFPEIPLEEYELSAPVPEFLTEEQQLLYRRASAVYLHLFGADTDPWDIFDGSHEHERVTEGDNSWLIANGRYADWADFDAMVHSVFTEEYFYNRNRDNFWGEEILKFREHEGKLAYIETGIGTGYWRNDNFPDTFELIEQTDDLIRFYLVGYYSYCYPLEGEVSVEGSYAARDMRLAAGYEYTDRWELRMVRTDAGWRFDSFADTSRDEHDYHGIYLGQFGGVERYTLDLSGEALPAGDTGALRRFDPVLKEGKSFLGGFAPNGEPPWLSHEMTLTSAREEFFSHMSERADVEAYALCDMDSDGEAELILCFDDPAGTYLALHREGEKFYGVFYYIRWLEDLQTNGVYVGSGGADVHYYHRLRFENGQAVEELLAEDVQGQYQVGGEEVGVEEFYAWKEANMSGSAVWYDAK